MEFLLWWLGLSLIPALIASKKGRSSVGYFALSIFISPLIATIVAVWVSDLTEPEIKRVPGKRCPYCDELIRKRAVVCRYCHRELAPMQ